MRIAYIVDGGRLEHRSSKSTSPEQRKSHMHLLTIFQLYGVCGASISKKRLGVVCSDCIIQITVDAKNWNMGLGRFMLVFPSVLGVGVGGQPYSNFLLLL